MVNQVFLNSNKKLMYLINQMNFFFYFYFFILHFLFYIFYSFFLDFSFLNIFF